MKTQILLILLIAFHTSVYAQSPGSSSQRSDLGAFTPNVGGPFFSGVGFSIGNKGYVGTGEKKNNSSYGNSLSKDFWEFDPVLDIWTQKANFAGAARRDAVGFSIGNKGYIGTGSLVLSNSSGASTNDFWEYDVITNSWSQKANFGGGMRNSAVGFCIGSKGYIGTGDNGNSTYYNDFWEYDPIADTWIEKDSIPGNPRSNASGFSIGLKGYIGTVTVPSPYAANSFWEYDQATGNWIRKADFGGGSGSDRCVSFSIGTKGYIGTGYIENDGVSNFWEYNQVTDTWARKTNFTNYRRDAIGFSIGSKGYVGAGKSYHNSHYNNYDLKNDFYEFNPANGPLTPITNNPLGSWNQKSNIGSNSRKSCVGFTIGQKGYVATGFHQDFWEYDILTNSWTQKADFIGGSITEAVAFSIGTKGYVGTGLIFSVGLTDDFYEYDQLTNQWTQKADYGGGPCWEAVGFSIGNKGYIGTGSSEFNRLQSFYEYNPFTDIWTQKASVPGGPRFSASGFSIDYKGYIGTGNDTNYVPKKDFWQYDPISDSWLARADFGGGERSQAIGFNICSKGYIGMGSGSYLVPSTNLFSYDPLSNTWQYHTTNRSRLDGIGFSIGNKGFYGLGESDAGYLADFWEFYPTHSITTATIPNSNFFTGESISVPYTKTGTYQAGNIFTAQLSDSTGSFATFQDIGSVTSMVAGSINAIIPPGTPAGTKYRVRVKSSTPYITSPDNGIDLKIFSINVGSINPLAYSVGQSVIVPFTIDGSFFSGNTFYAQLSDSNGSFANPVAIGFVYSTTSGAINATIPMNTLVGSNYRIRVVSTIPEGISENDNGSNISILKLITGTISPLSYCVNTTVSVPFTAEGSFTPGNVFYAQISDATGSFSSAVNIGSVSSITSGTINATIPLSIPSGSAYRIRVISSTPFIITDDNGGNITTGPPVPVNTNTVSAVSIFSGTARDEAVSFSIGTKGYLGTGFDGTYRKDFWEYDSESDAWTQKADFGGIARAEACGFSIGNKGYLGTGRNASIYFSDFWEYDPIANTWSSKTSYSSACSNAIGLSITGKGYIGTGKTSAGYNSTFAEYDPGTNAWTTKASVPGTLTRQGAAAFTIGDRGFVGTGFDGTSGLYKNDFYEYNPASNTWITRTNVTGVGRSNAFAFSIGNRGYIGGGYTGASTLSDLHEYNIIWTSRGSVFGLQGSCAFSASGKGYFGTGLGAVRVKNFYKFEPEPSILTEPLSPLSYCPENSVAVSYSIGGVFNCGNEFTAQLSNASGSFASPVNIGSIVSFYSGTINAIIPANTPNGTGYRIRIISTNPVASGINVGSSISILSAPVVSIGSNSPVCASTVLNLTSGGGINYNWTGPNGFISSDQNPVIANVTDLDAGTYTVNVSIANGCSSSSSVEVSIIPQNIYYADNDSDNFGDTTNSQLFCEPTGIYTTLVGGDCNDTNSSLHPDVTEVLNGLDENCNGIIDEGTFLQLNVKLFIQGLYSGSGLMNSVLFNNNMSLSPNECDYITLELYESTPPYSSVANQFNLLLTNGNAEFLLPPTVYNKSYYLVIRNRNSLETWSQNPVNFTSEIINYDFTLSGSQAFGSNLVNLGDGNFAVFSGDVNQDGIIDDLDYAEIENSTQLFLYGYLNQDLNGDVLVETSDFSLIENNLNKSVVRP